MARGELLLRVQEICKRFRRGWFFCVTQLEMSNIEATMCAVRLSESTCPNNPLQSWQTLCKTHSCKGTSH